MKSNRRKRFLFPFLFVFIFLSLGSFRYVHSFPAKNPYLFKLGSKTFSTEEFEYYFSKNNDQLTKDSVEFKVQEYLDLFIKFRLKVLEAENRNMHEDPEFISEFGGYKKQLVKPYLMESKMSEALVQEAYKRMQEEVRASHVLLKVNEDALPEDTLKVYNRLMDIKAVADNGLDFDSLARKISEDPSAKQNGGDLGYFSAFRMVYPFEDAAFNTPVGKVSDAVRTRFGYHLIYVKDRRKAQGKVKTAHIMLRVNEKLSLEEQKNIESKISSIHKKLLSGEDWNELCKLYSEDNNTKDKGGELNWFGTGSLVKEFEEVAFGLEKKESISKPFKTRFGWHIVKLLDKKSIEPLAEIRKDLESKISRDSRSKVKKNQTIATLKKQNGYQLTLANKQLALSAIDSSILEGNWKMESSQLINNTIFSLKDVNYSSWEFANFVQKRQNKRKGITIADYAKSLYNQFEEKCIFEFEERNIEQNNEEYRMILQEYRDGILLFNLMEKEVWGKAVKDTLGQKEYYNAHLQDYKVGESVKARIFVSDSQETIEKARTFTKRTKKEIDRAFNGEEPLNLQVFDKTVERGMDADIDKYWSVGLHNFEKDERKYLLLVQEIIPAGYKPLTSIKGQVISDYQNELESKWIEKLKSKYPVRINKSTLRRVIKKIENQL